ncbi:MAG TPA: metallophosphoesterase [Pirellulaceae bacterium]|nr:metallophosphoesterase [Pirellulaceae bacterium]HMO92141.1 metallophosphoesterase [Pirellulaceae bacterium]HMP68934.1 metallophosphoesterase [Pirellulaceae bacterium]
MLELAWILLAIVGHLGLWSAIFNQVHATGWVRIFRKISERIIYAIVISLGLALLIIYNYPKPESLFVTSIVYYGHLCVFLAIVLSIRWVYREVSRYLNPPPMRVVSCNIIRVGSLFDKEMIQGWQAKLLRWIPGNQVLELAIEHKALKLRKLPSKLRNLRIVHLGDLHFTGKISHVFFERVVEQINQLSPDLVCLSGDIVDERECLDWIPDLLSRVRANYAKLFVLGNHDLRIKDEQEIRTLMREADWIDVEGHWRSFEIRGEVVTTAGNALPWFGHARQLPPRAPMDNELRIAISHSPDQLRWAQQLDFHLMLAGHNHGGQVRFPLIGPVISPSIYGVKYASGVFEEQGLVIHVTRGVSADDPIRWNCRPELTLLTLEEA